jgi:hypothetical protein
METRDPTQTPDGASGPSPSGPYVLEAHYTETDSTHGRLTCSRFARALADWLSEAAPALLSRGGQGLCTPSGHPRHADPVDQEPDDDGADPARAPWGGHPDWDCPSAHTDAKADLGNDAHWRLAARLRWALRSDRAVGAREAARLVADLREDGDLEAVRGAYCRLAAALAAAYPALGTDLNALVQLAALGRDLANGAGQTPDIREYAKNELQPVDLAALLGL